MKDLQKYINLTKRNTSNLKKIFKDPKRNFQYRILTNITKVTLKESNICGQISYKTMIPRKRN